MPHVIIRESRHREIAVVVSLLEPDPHSPSLSVLCGSLLELFG